MKVVDNHPVFWRIDLPGSYFNSLASDGGLVLGHPDDYTDLVVFSGNWSDYENEEYLEKGIVHTVVDLISSDGERKTVTIPQGAGRYYCFNDFSGFPQLNFYPTIFQAKDKIVSLCSCTSNWDGLMESSIVTLCVSTGLFLNQYFEESWIKEMVSRYSELADDVHMWSNGGVKLFLDEEEKRLLIHSDYLGSYEASLVLEWRNDKWKFSDFVPGAFSHVDSDLKFNISQSSLDQREVYQSSNNA